MTAPAPATAPVCAHLRVQTHGEPRLAKGPPPDDQPARTGYEARHGMHVVQSGSCLDCGWPVIRYSAQVALGPWATVANGTPGPRRRRHGERYG